MVESANVETLPFVYLRGWLGSHAFGVTGNAMRASVYMHIFGLVLTVAVFAALLPRVWREWTSRVPNVAAVLGEAALSSGFMLCVIGAVRLGEGGGPADAAGVVLFPAFVRDLVRFVRP